MIKELTKKGVVINIDGWQHEYVNSTSGRTSLEINQPVEIVAEVIKVWGDTPTVPDYTPEEETTSTVSPTPTIEQRTAALEGAMLTMLGGAANVCV